MLIADDLIDHAFIKTRTVGFDALKARAAMYPAEKAAAICGISAGAVRELARAYGRAGAPPYIRTGWGPSRQLGGAMAMRTIALLPGPGGRLQAARRRDHPQPGRCTVRPLFFDPARSLPAGHPQGQHGPSGPCPDGTGRPADQIPACVSLQPGGGGPPVAPGHGRPGPGRPVRLGAGDVHDGHGSYGRYHSPGGQLPGSQGPLPGLRPQLYPAGGAGHPAGGPEPFDAGHLPGPGGKDGFLRRMSFSLTEDQCVDRLLKEPSPYMVDVDANRVPIRVAPCPSISRTTRTPNPSTPPSGKVEFYSRAWEAKGLDPLPDGRPVRDPEGGERFPLEFITPPHRLFLNSAFNEIAALREEGRTACSS